MKIAYFCDNFYPQVNGVVTASLAIAKEMENRGHEVLFVVIKPPKSYPFDSKKFPFELVMRRGIKAYFYPDFYLTSPFSLSIIRKLKKLGVDIIHYHSPMAIASQGIFVAKILKKPLIGTFHTFFAEDEYLKVVHMDKFPFIKRIGWAFSNLFYNRCDIVTSPTQITKDIMLENHAKVPIEVLPNAIDLDIAKKAKKIDQKLVKKYKLDKIDKKKKKLVFVGRVSEEKSIDLLIKGMPKILEKDKNVELVIIGDGPIRKKLEKIAEDLNVIDNVFFTGMIPNKVLLSSGLMRFFDVYVTASTSENHSISALEAMIFELPMVGADAKGLKTAIKKNGYRFIPNNIDDYAKKIIKILSDKKKLKTMSKESFKLVETYSFKNIGDKWEKLYNKMIKLKSKK